MMNNQDVVIVSALRTPFGRFGGLMKDLPSVELGARVIKTVIERAGVEPSLVEELYYGTCMLAENALNQNVLARQALLKAGLPPKTISLSIDRACCSSMTALHLCYRQIRSGEREVMIAAGAENMSRVPYLLHARWGSRLGLPVMEDNLYELGYRDWNAVSLDAGEVAVEEGVTREEQDQWALLSHRRYFEALQAGRFNQEIMPLEVVTSKRKRINLDADEQARPDISLEELQKLPTVYTSPTVTAGNAPGLNTGAAAILLMSRSKAEKLGIKPLAVIRSIAGIAAEARNIARAPAIVIKKILDDQELTVKELDLIEINEAFAAMPLVSGKMLLGQKMTQDSELAKKLNVNGGAIAIGHPLGASGARLVMTLAYELNRRGGGRGVAAICGGLAQGDATLIEVEGS